MVAMAFMRWTIYVTDWICRGTTSQKIATESGMTDRFIRQRSSVCRARRNMKKPVMM